MGRSRSGLCEATGDKCNLIHRSWQLLTSLLAEPCLSAELSFLTCLVDSCDVLFYWSSVTPRVSARTELGAGDMARTYARVSITRSVLHVGCSHLPMAPKVCWALGERQGEGRRSGVLATGDGCISGICFPIRITSAVSISRTSSQHLRITLHLV